VRRGGATREQEAYNLVVARRTKMVVGCPVMVVGGARSLEVTEEIISSNDADYVSLSRPFIRESGLALRWQKGNRERATCTSCNGCFKPLLHEGGIYCVVDKIARDSREYSS